MQKVQVKWIRPGHRSPSPFRGRSMIPLLSVQRSGRLVNPKNKQPTPSLARLQTATRPAFLAPKGASLSYWTYPTGALILSSRSLRRSVRQQLAGCNQPVSQSQCTMHLRVLELKLVAWMQRKQQAMSVQTICAPHVEYAHSCCWLNQVPLSCLMLDVCRCDANGSELPIPTILTCGLCGLKPSAENAWGVSHPKPAELCSSNAYMPMESHQQDHPLKSHGRCGSSEPESACRTAALPAE